MNIEENLFTDDPLAISQNMDGANVNGDIVATCILGDLRLFLYRRRCFDYSHHLVIGESLQNYAWSKLMDYSSDGKRSSEFKELYLAMIEFNNGNDNDLLALFEPIRNSFPVVNQILGDYEELAIGKQLQI